MAIHWKSILAVLAGAAVMSAHATHDRYSRYDNTYGYSYDSYGNAYDRDGNSIGRVYTPHRSTASWAPACPLSAFWPGCCGSRDRKYFSGPPR